MIRTLIALGLATICGIACSSPPESPTPGRDTPALDQGEPVQAQAAPAQASDPAREANLAAYERDGARLAEESPGQWVLISGGVTFGPWRTFDEAWAAAETTAGSASHAFLYRAGVDDVDVTFLLSPFGPQRSRWTQIGMRLRRPMKLTMLAVGDVWQRQVNGSTLTAAWGDAGARLVVASPDGAREVTVRGVASGLFEEDLTITASMADELGLGRFEAPGAAYYVDEHWPCRKVVVRLRIPELEIDLPAVAYVLPRELTKGLSSNTWRLRGPQD